MKEKKERKKQVENRSKTKKTKKTKQWVQKEKKWNGIRTEQNRTATNRCRKKGNGTERKAMERMENKNKTYAENRKRKKRKNKNKENRKQKEQCRTVLTANGIKKTMATRNV